MAIDKDTHLVNTERLRVKKLSAKFWEEVEAVERLTDLLLISVEDVSPYLEKIRSLKFLERLKIAQIDLDERISNLVLPTSLTQLDISSVSCADWTALPDAPHVKTFVHKRMDMRELCVIYPKLPGVELVQLAPDDDDELNVAFDVIKGLENVKQVELDILDASREALLPVFKHAFDRQMKLELAYSGDLEQDELKDIVAPFKDYVDLI